MTRLSIGTTPNCLDNSEANTEEDYDIQLRQLKQRILFPVAVAEIVIGLFVTSYFLFHSSIGFSSCIIIVTAVGIGIPLSLTGLTLLVAITGIPYQITKLRSRVVCVTGVTMIATIVVPLPIVVFSYNYLQLPLDVQQQLVAKERMVEGANGVLWPLLVFSGLAFALYAITIKSCARILYFPGKCNSKHTKILTL